MGNIKKLPNGNYRTTVYDINNIRHRKTFRRKTEAEAYISKIEIIKNENKLINIKLKKVRYPVEDAIDSFYLTKTDRRPKTVTKYGNFVKQFKLFCNAFQIKYLDEFTTEHAEIFYKELTKEKRDPKGSTDRILRPKPRTVNYYLRKARAFFQEELIKGHLEKNPMIVIKNLRVERQPPEYYTQEEIKAFFQQEMHHVYRNAFTVLLHTGMRFEELASLTWDDIDLGKKLIYVRPKEDFKTKTYRSIRSIPMNDVMIKLFNELSKKRDNPILPICSVEGKKFRERRLYYICNKIGKKAGIKGKITLHKFRHTFASQLVQNNVRIEIVQKLLGHSSIKETSGYAHVRSENLHEDVHVLDSLFGTVGEGEKAFGHNLGTSAKKVVKINDKQTI